jgi:hypothetical protein
MGSRSLRLRRPALSLFSIALLVTIGGACRLVPLGVAVAHSHMTAGGDAPQVPSVPADHPLTVLVRGWLWDASSQGRAKVPVRLFQPRVNEILEQQIGKTSDFFDYQWSRLPKDVWPESVRFVKWASALSEQAAEEGRCVNFVGHSAGAAFVYRAAGEGVQMGFLGTLGLPTFGRGRPEHVDNWTNFFTSSHTNDIAGRLWGKQMAADQNVDLRQEHRYFWFAEPVASASAAGIGQAWTDCRP